jgi:hypothetical protein
MTLRQRWSAVSESTPSIGTAQPNRPAGMPPHPVVRPIPRWVIATAGPLLIVVAAAIVWLLLGLDVDAVSLTAIRTGGAVSVGLGGIAALWLAIRRQHSTELDLVQKHEAHLLAVKVATDNYTHQQRTADATERDATARRITEQYGKAVDQLGSEKAPVRLGGVLALERLAQDSDNASLRQTVVNVLCAYLRMPFETQRPSGDHRTTSASAATRDPAEWQEREVRRTAQDVLQRHLTPGPGPDPALTYWPDIDIDLTFATLLYINLTNAHVRSVRFGGANLLGSTHLTGAVIDGQAIFGGTRFELTADFSHVTITGEARFRGAYFADQAFFTNARFDGETHFGGTRPSTPGRPAEGATFTQGATFTGATFAQPPTLENLRTRSPLPDLHGWLTTSHKTETTDGETWITTTH